MTIPIDPPILVEPRDVPAFTLTTFEEAGQWADKELASWEPLRSIGVGSPMSGWKDELTDSLLQIKEAVRRVRERPDERDTLSAANETITRAVQSYPKGPSIASGSPDGQRILQRFARGDQVGAIVEAGLLVNHRTFDMATIYRNQPLPIDARMVVEELIKSVVWEEMDRARIDASAASHGLILQQFKDRLDKRLSEFQTTNDELRQKNVELENRIAIMKQAEQRLRHSIATALLRARRDFQATRQTYLTDMSLRAPATYWKRRGNRSMMAAIGAFAGFVLAGVLVACIINLEFAGLRDWVVDQNGKVDAAALIALSPIVVVMLWFFRMFTRLYGVAVGETVDAGQRSVMVTTFLSIMNDPHSKLSDAERYLILQALFRSSASKDDVDTMPSNLAEVMARLAPGRS